jgi:hypothetical protein
MAEGYRNNPAIFYLPLKEWLVISVPADRHAAVFI